MLQTATLLVVVSFRSRSSKGSMKVFIIKSRLVKRPGLLYVTDKYFVRDGKNCGVSTEFVVSGNLNHDIWTPLDCGWEEARKHTKREFIIDEYCVSRNLARFRTPYIGLFQEEPVNKAKWLVHLGVGSGDNQKDVLEKAKETLLLWQ